MAEQACHPHRRRWDPGPRDAFPCRPSSGDRGDRNRVRGRLDLFFHSEEQPGPCRERMLDHGRERPGLLLGAERLLDRDRNLHLFQRRLDLSFQPLEQPGRCRERMLDQGRKRPGLLLGAERLLDRDRNLHLFQRRLDLSFQPLEQLGSRPDRTLDLFREHGDLLLRRRDPSPARPQEPAAREPPWSHGARRTSSGDRREAPKSP